MLNADEYRKLDLERAPKTITQAELFEQIHHLCRLGLEGKTEDVRMITRRLGRRLRGVDPEFSKRLFELIPVRLQDILREKESP